MKKIAIGNICLALILLISLGAKANATAIKIGQNASATVDDSIAIGVSSFSNTRYAVALGSTTRSLGFGSTAIGYGTYSSAPGATAVGYGSQSMGNYSSAVGFRATATGKNSAVLGYSSEARGSGNLVLGENLVADGVGSMILGRSEEGSPIINSVPNSFSINFFSKTPTFFVAGGSSGVAGKVGIGTNAPQASLDVIGDIKSDSLKAKLISTEVLESPDLKSKSAQVDNLVGNSAELNQAKINFVESDSIRSESIDVNSHLRATIIESKETKAKSILTRDLQAEHIESDVLVNSLTYLKNLDVSDTTEKDKEDSVILTAHLDTNYASSKHEEQLKMLKSKKVSTEEDAKKYYSLYEKETKDKKLAEHYLSMYKKLSLLAEDIQRQIDEILNGAELVARVGVGTRTPQQTLHISGAARLEPLAFAPTNASMGDLYMDQSGALCVFIDSWEVLAGQGYCNQNEDDLPPKDPIKPSPKI